MPEYLSPGLLLGLHLLATWFLVGLIWVIQVVHYPLMRHIGPAEFCTYENAHTWRMLAVVLPPMLVELLSGFALWALLPQLWSEPLWLAAAVLLAYLWFSTGLYFAPLHQKLCRQYNQQLIGRMVRANWTRTLAWSLRGVLLVLLLAKLPCQGNL